MLYIIFAFAAFAWLGVCGLIYAINANHGRHIDLWIQGCDRQECINSDLQRQIDELREFTPLKPEGNEDDDSPQDS